MGPGTRLGVGVPVRYLNDATGEPDSEGVTAVDGKVYVASERDNTNDTVSKISVLEVNPSNIVAQNGDKDGDLNATHEWDLGSDLGPNPGINPDRARPEQPRRRQPGHRGRGVRPGLLPDERRIPGRAHRRRYNPANYPNHVDGGVFFVGLEEDREALRLRLQQRRHLHPRRDDQHRLPDDPGPALGPSQDALWATCDNGCQGRSSILRVDTNADAPRAPSRSRPCTRAPSAPHRT